MTDTQETNLDGVPSLSPVWVNCAESLAPELTGDDFTMILTEQLLKTICNGGGYNSAQLNILGQPSTAKRGWKEQVIGRQISEDDFALLLQLKGAKPPKQREIYPQVITTHYPKRNKQPK